jgi:cytidylate kinase
MPIVTISSQFGAEGPAVGSRLAQRLGVEYVDKDIIHRIALDLQVDQEKVAEFDEGRHNRLRGFLSTVFDFDALRRNAKVAEGGATAAAYDDREEIPYNYQVKGWIDRDIYRQMMVRVVTAIGARGAAVIKGRGSQFILKDNPGALHVRFVANEEDRIARTMGRRGLDREAARRLIEEMDRRGERYARDYFGGDLEADLNYDLVLNTSRISLDACLDVLELLARRLPSSAT